MKLYFASFMVCFVFGMISQQTFSAEIPPQGDTNTTRLEQTPLEADQNDTLVTDVTETVLSELQVSEDKNIAKIQGANETQTTYISDTPSLKHIEELSKQLTLKPNTNGTDRVSEVDDLNKNVDVDLLKSFFTSPTFEVHDVENTVSAVKIADEVGPIQSNENEDDREAKKALIEQLNKDQEIILDAGPLVNTPANSGGNAGQIPVIVASIFVILCMIGYTAMLMWRRHLERKYGNREMLVNDDLDPNDMRHFSI